MFYAGAQGGRLREEHRSCNPRAGSAYLESPCRIPG